MLALESFVFLSSINIKIETYKTIILPVALCGCATWSLHIEGRTQIEDV
jgi:hypothetical protein